MRTAWRSAREMIVSEAAQSFVFSPARRRRLSPLSSIRCALAVAAGLVPEGASEPGLPRSGWTDDGEVVAVAHPLAGCERLEESAIEAA